MTNSIKLKKFFLDQHGCAKNQVDGEIIINRLQLNGYEQTFEPSDADLIIVNSCGFIESAKKESLDAVYSAKKNFPNAKIILAGCLAERYASVFEKELPEADAIFGNGDLSKIDSVIKKIERKERPVEIYKQQGVCCGERKTLLGFRGSAFVKITEGCSNHCSFCAIPLIRGELRSRPAKKIVEEIKNLVSKGIVEINLIGQDLAAYGTGKNDNVFGEQNDSLCKANNKSFLACLLEKISEIEGFFRVRLLYIHPDHFNEDILPIMQSDERILPYFDIPFQSGDDSIIRAMNRKGSREIYENLLKKIRASLPDSVIRTTFLTGFPGETDENAENSVKFLKNIQSDWSGCFPYSREEDTPAYNYKNRVSAKIAKKRAQRLSEIQKEITKKKLLSKVGTIQDVLIEEIIEGEDFLAIGRAWFQAPDVDGNVVIHYDRDNENENDAVQPGKMVKAKIVSASDVDLDAIYVSPANQDSKNQQEKTSLKYAPEMV